MMKVMTMVVMMVFIVTITVMAMMRMRVIMPTGVIVPTLNGSFAVTAAAYCTHQSTSNALTRISSPPVTCN